MSRAVKAHDEAGKAFATQGMVVLDGPDGVAVTLSPDSAEQTGRNLIAAAADARTQQAGEGGDGED